MVDETKHDTLHAAIDTILQDGATGSTGDEELDALVRVASGLRGLPNPEFKAQLRQELAPGTRQAVWWPSLGGLVARVKGLAVLPWLRRNRPFAAAGGSCGLLAGTCCISGAVASVVGLASAAAVAAFIDSTLPYFVAASVAGLLAWMAARLLQEQNLSLKTIALTVRSHGLAMGTAYSAVFGASMGLAMALGLY